jgi:hypothetical protein
LFYILAVNELIIKVVNIFNEKVILQVLEEQKEEVEGYNYSRCCLLIYLSFECSESIMDSDTSET